jgi:hypothetical protein
VQATEDVLIRPVVPAFAALHPAHVPLHLGDVALVIRLYTVGVDLIGELVISEFAQLAGLALQIGALYFT